MPKNRSQTDSQYPQSDRELIRLIERSPSHRAGYKQLIRELGLGGGRERRLLLEQLARITLRGDLVKLDTGQWALPHATPEKTARVRPVSGLRNPTEDYARPPARGQARSASGRLWLRAPRMVQHRGEDDLFIPPQRAERRDAG